MVEAPGTAPGSDGFITIAIYRHSPCGQELYRRFNGWAQMVVALRRERLYLAPLPSIVGCCITTKPLWKTVGGFIRPGSGVRRPPSSG